MVRLGTAWLSFGLGAYCAATLIGCDGHELTSSPPDAGAGVAGAVSARAGRWVVPSSAGGGGTGGHGVADGSSCGDGQRAASEQCDDGNFSNGDGCGRDCVVELGWTCRGERTSECLPLWTLDLVPWVTQLVRTLPGAGSEAFVVPEPIELTAFAVAVDVLIHDDWSAAAGAAAPIGYRVVVLDDLAAPSAPLLALVPDSWTALEPVGGAGRGLYIIRPAAGVGVDLVLEAPHPRHDAYTATVAALAFRQLKAHALAVASTHRCANQAPSLCSGTTSACGSDRQPYRESDMAHTSEAFFQVFHQATDTLLSSTIVQVHGMSSPRDQPIASVSDGTTANVVNNQYLSSRLASEITTMVLAAGSSKRATSCNRSGDPNLLCGSTNAQGRFTNGVAPSAVCTSHSGGIANGRFLHIELGPQLRGPNSPLGPQLFIQALANTLH